MQSCLYEWRMLTGNQINFQNLIECDTPYYVKFRVDFKILVKLGDDRLLFSLIRILWTENKFPSNLHFSQGRTPTCLIKAALVLKIIG